jgi:hypothetical protein
MNRLQYTICYNKRAFNTIKGGKATVRTIIDPWSRTRQFLPRNFTFPTSAESGTLVHTRLAVVSFPHDHIIPL